MQRKLAVVCHPDPKEYTDSYPKDEWLYRPITYCVVYESASELHAVLTALAKGYLASQQGSELLAAWNPKKFWININDSYLIISDLIGSIYGKHDGVEGKNVIRPFVVLEWDAYFEQNQKNQTDFFEHHMALYAKKSAKQ